MTTNEEQLALTLDAIGDLRRDVVLLGGAAIHLLVTDPGAPTARPTKDVDLVVDQTAHGLHRVEARLRRLGFNQHPELDDPVCRWRKGSVVIDVMPIDPGIHGASNRWYRLAWDTAEERAIAHHRVRVVRPLVFIATKLEAFAGRGGDDYQASHDLEDVIAVVDGRAEIVEEIDAAPAALRAHLAGRLGALLYDERFVDAVAGHLPGDDASQDRLPVVLERLRVLAGRAR